MGRRVGGALSAFRQVSNGPAHALAHLGKNGNNGVLCGAAPTCVSVEIPNDCKNIVA
jgi:hypothetical protein